MVMLSAREMTGPDAALYRFYTVGYRARILLSALRRIRTDRAPRRHTVEGPCGHAAYGSTR